MVHLLKDDELVAQLTSPHPILSGLAQPPDWFSKTSPVQPSSVDLHIGKICVPEVEKGKLGSHGKPFEGDGTQHVLRPGQTAVVATREKVQLPDNLAAFGFPPSLISSRGILMTNPGHVDPGFSGVLHFTVINMGAKDFALVVGETIVTLLIVKLSGDATRGWQSRRRTPPAAAQAGQQTDAVSKLEQQLEMLSADFLDVQRRSTTIAEDVVNRTTWKVGLATALVAAVATIGGLVVKGWQDASLKDVQKEISVLKKEIELTDFESDLDEIKRKIESIEQQSVGDRGAAGSLAEPAGKTPEGNDELEPNPKEAPGSNESQDTDDAS